MKRALRLTLGALLPVFYECSRVLSSGYGTRWRNFEGEIIYDSYVLFSWVCGNGTYSQFCILFILNINFIV